MLQQGAHTSWLDDDRYDAALQAETARFAEAVHDADPARPVPTCPEWTLAQLTEHVGQAQRWVTVVLERRAPVPNAQVRARVPEDPDPDERSAWLVAGARRLAQAVREVGPATRVWSWSEDQTARFWLRRTTHDTLVHRADAELAVGREVAVEPALAADGVADLLDMFAVLPRVDDFPELAELAGDGQTLHFCATDDDLGAAGEWLARRAPAGLAWERAHGPADLTVRGRAADLLLVLTRRAAPRGRVEVAGDEALFAHWLDHSRF
jgi:uncharacterized protein (TIGR03083 family)